MEPGLNRVQSIRVEFQNRGTAATHRKPAAPDSDEAASFRGWDVAIPSQLNVCKDHPFKLRSRLSSEAREGNP